MSDMIFDYKKGKVNLSLTEFSAYDMENYEASPYNVTITRGGYMTHLPFLSTVAVSEFAEIILDPDRHEVEKMKGFTASGFDFSIRYSQINHLVLFFCGPLHLYLYFSPKQTRNLHHCCQALLEFLREERG